MISKHLANISGLLGRDQTLQHIQYLESRMKNPLQLLQRAAKCSADVADKDQGLSSEGMSAGKVQIFLFSFMATLGEYNSEVLIYLFIFQAKVHVPTEEPDNSRAGSVSPGSHPGLCCPFPTGSSPSQNQLGIPPTHGHSLGNPRLANGAVLQSPLSWELSRVRASRLSVQRL